MLYNNYDSILAATPEKVAGIWDELFNSFTENTLYRENYIILAKDRVLLIKEENESRGPAIAWNYILDEWCFPAMCMNLGTVQQHLGIPPLMSNVLEVAMSTLSYDFNSVLIYDQLKEVHFSSEYYRSEQNGIDTVHTYILFDFGDNDVKTDLDLRHSPLYFWFSMKSLDTLEVHNLSHVRKILEQYKPSLF